MDDQQFSLRDGMSNPSAYKRGALYEFEVEIGKKLAHIAFSWQALIKPIGPYHGGTSIERF